MENLRQLLIYIRPHKRRILFAVLLTGSLTLIGMAPPLLMRRLINDVAAGGRWGLFPLIMTLLVAVPVFRAIINLGASISLNTVGLGIIRDTRRRMFRHMMYLSTDYHQSAGSGAMQQRLMGDVGVVSGLMSGGIVTLMSDIVAVVFAVSVMLRLSPGLSALTLALLPLYFLNYRYFSHRIHSTTTALRANMDHISSTLQERLNAHQLIQSYGQEKAEAMHFSSQSKQVMDAAVRGTSYSIAFNQLSAFVNRVGNSLIYCAGCYFFVTGSMGYGDVIAFCAYATQILGPVVRFVTVANQIKQAGVSIERINEIMSRQPAVKDHPEPRSVRKLRGDVELRKASFRIGGERSVLKDVDLSLRAGTHLAIMGGKGRGKTVLAMLLRRFYDPTSGLITVDGVDIRSYKLKDYRNATGMVQSRSSIFAGTIRENLCYGHPEADEEQMMAVSKLVGLHDAISRLRRDYDTRIGAGGMCLSSGIQQKLGIARALLHAPHILVLDDAVATLDPDSAHTAVHAVRSSMEGKTCVMILSRALLALSADMVAVMGEDGKLAELGPPKELLLQPESAYRSIFTAQYGADVIASAVNDWGGGK